MIVYTKVRRWVFDNFLYNYNIILNTMRNIYLTLILFILTGPFLFGQSLFDNLTSEAPADDAKKTSFELSGFARGVVHGGAKDFD